MTTIATQQQSALQAIIKKTNIPHQCIPFICVFIIAKTPTILLAGFIFGYYMLFKQQDEKKLIEAPSEPPFVAHHSLEYDNEPRYASINHSTSQDDQQDDISNASIDFENLMKFPSCPTTLPRLDTHFNFVSDDDNHHHLQENNSIDWSAIHQELEYDEQRNAKPTGIIKKEQLPLFTSQSQNDMLTFSSSSSSSEEDEDVSSLLSLEALMKQTTASTTSPLPHDNTAAAILLVDQSDHPDPLIPSTRSTTSFTSHIHNMALLEDILLLPSPMPLPKPSLSSPGQLFKSKFQKAVSKMKKSNPNSGKDDNVNSRRSSTYSQDSFVTSSTSKKASSLQIQSYFPNPSSPRPSASARINDHLKGRFNKLFKK